MPPIRRKQVNGWRRDYHRRKFWTQLSLMTLAGNPAYASMEPLSLQKEEWQPLIPELIVSIIKAIALELPTQYRETSCLGHRFWTRWKLGSYGRLAHSLIV